MLMMASEVRKLMPLSVAPTKSQLLKYRRQLLGEILTKIGEAAKNGKKRVFLKMQDKYYNDGYWLARELQNLDFEVGNWATGSAEKTSMTIAWVGGTPSPYPSFWEFFGYWPNFKITW
jgi:hypothetical protein